MLSRVVEHLAQNEGYSLNLVGGKKIQLKSSPGPINRAYPRIELRCSGTCQADMNVRGYAAPGQVFGIDFIHEAM